MSVEIIIDIVKHDSNQLVYRNIDLRNVGHVAKVREKDENQKYMMQLFYVQTANMKYIFINRAKLQTKWIKWGYLFHCISNISRFRVYKRVASTLKHRNIVHLLLPDPTWTNGLETYRLDMKKEWGSKKRKRDSTVRGKHSYKSSYSALSFFY